MLAKIYRDKSIIPRGFFIVLGAIVASTILLQSPPFAFADDLSEGVTDAARTDVPVVVPSPAPPTTDISLAPVAPAEGVAGGGAATGSIAVAPPASSAGAGKYYLGLWRKSGNRWWFSYPCGCFAKGWKEIDDTWYFFDSRGWMKTGWQKIGKHWYYLEKSGAMKTGWRKSGESWYYLESSGAMAKGWVLDKGEWYYLNRSGAMATGWNKIKGNWFYLTKSGGMKTGWQKSGGSWYYLQPSGAMATCTWIDSYYVDASGAWVPNKTK